MNKKRITIIDHNMITMAIMINFIKYVHIVENLFINCLYKRNYRNTHIHIRIHTHDHTHLYS